MFYEKNFLVLAALLFVCLPPMWIKLCVYCIIVCACFILEAIYTVFLHEEKLEVVDD